MQFSVNKSEEAAAGVAVGEEAEDLGAMMAAFDMLPECLRETLNNAHFELQVFPLWRAWFIDGANPEELAETIRAIDAQTFDRFTELRTQGFYNRPTNE